ncbi:MAG TPA: sulfatase [Vicinamibacterales bacterium]
MERRDFLKSAGAALAIGPLSKAAASTAEQPRPFNLLLLTVDDMNWSMPGFMGGKNQLTPSLDALAARSHRFVNNRTVAPICQPSREAMMTGRVPHRSGGLGFTPIHDGIPTLITILKERSYYTTGIHKLEHMQPASCFPWDHRVAGMGRDPLEYADAMKDAINEARSSNRPFFINCNLNDPHRPFYGSPQAAQVDQNETGRYKVANELGAEDVEIPSFLENLPAIRQEYAQYCNSVQRADITIGKVLTALQATPEADNTVVVFSADHGMPFPFSKATVYTNGTRTPVLISYPGMGKPRTFKALTANIDILPTLLDVLSISQPEAIDGHSWMPLMRGQAAKDREYVITHVNTVNSGAAFPMRAIQNEKYALVFSPWSDGKLHFQVESMLGLTFEAMRKAAETDPRIAARVDQYIIGIPLAFYDLAADPDQRVNRIDSKEHRAEIGKMKKLLLDYMTRTHDPELENYRTLLAGGKPVVVQPAGGRGDGPGEKGNQLTTRKS